MTFEEYQKQAVSFRTESANNEAYLVLGLISEVGEAAGKLAKRIRDGVFDEMAFVKELGDILWFVANLAEFYGESGAQIAFKDALCDRMKIADFISPSSRVRMLAVLATAVANGEEHVWNFKRIVNNLARIAAKFGYTLEQVAEINIAKLRDRQARGAIKGNGDER